MLKVKSLEFSVEIRCVRFADTFLYNALSGKSLPLGGEGGALARRMRGKCPAAAPSSVTFGDSFPQEGEATDAVYP